MPYKSDAQRRFFHSDGAAKAGITPNMVKEWDESSKGADLPERKGSTHDHNKRRLHRAIQKAILGK